MEGLILTLIFVGIVCLLVWTGSRFNDPETPPQEPADPARFGQPKPGGHYRRYKEAWDDLKEILGRQPTTDELIGYVYAKREIDEMTGENSE